MKAKTSRLFLAVVVLFLAVSVSAQENYTAGVSSGDTLSDAFHVGSGELAYALVCPSANATDSLNVQVWDGTDGYVPLFWDDAEYFIVVSNSKENIAVLDQNVFYYVKHFKLDMLDAAGDTITYILLTRER